MHALANGKQLSQVRKKLFADPLPYSKPRQMKRSVIHKSDAVNAWCLPFLGSDRSVMTRSQQSLYAYEKKPPIQVQTYIQFK